MRGSRGLRRVRRQRRPGGAGGRGGLPDFATATRRPARGQVFRAEGGHRGDYDVNFSAVEVRKAFAVRQPGSTDRRSRGSGGRAGRAAICNGALPAAPLNVDWPNPPLPPNSAARSGGDVVTVADGRSAHLLAPLILPFFFFVLLSGCCSGFPSCFFFVRYLRLCLPVRVSSAPVSYHLCATSLQVFLSVLVAVSY